MQSLCQVECVSCHEHVLLCAWIKACWVLQYYLLSYVLSILHDLRIVYMYFEIIQIGIDFGLHTVMLNLVLASHLPFAAADEPAQVGM